MKTLHFVTHTHWDREWYLPFQTFRLKLIHLVDKLLEIMENDPEYRYFMLDGQMIVLEDLLHMRPEHEPRLRALISQGRLQIGPWYILPDEFLVSPEATVRNLLQGLRSCRTYDSRMLVGYSPDPFGHISQLPQILAGFGIHTAAFRRGLADEPCEVWWQAPDGTRVLTAYLRDSYDNAAWLPADQVDIFSQELTRLRDSLAGHSASTNLLLLNGTDHMEPDPHTSQALAATRQQLGSDRLVHSTLEAYLQAVRAELAHSGTQIPVVTGELRNPQRHHLLPGVLSARMWIKQRNHASQCLLEGWVEPFSTWASMAVRQRNSLSGKRLANPAGIIRQAWRLLMENHPHDSICGCSIDQVHREMEPRFDQVDQIGELLVDQALTTLAEQVDSRQAPAGSRAAVVVFNPVQWARTDAIRIAIELPAGLNDFAVVDETGNPLAHTWHGTTGERLAEFNLGRAEMQMMMALWRKGEMNSYRIRAASARQEASKVLVDIVASDQAPVNQAALSAISADLEKFLADETITAYGIVAHTPLKGELNFIAPSIPGNGWRTFWLRAEHPVKQTPELDQSKQAELVIQNETWRVAVDRETGALCAVDLRSGVVYSGVNAFVSGGDCGDEYNTCPPRQDRLVGMESAQSKSFQVERRPGQELLTIRLRLPVPASLSPDRQSRSAECVDIEIESLVCLTAGNPRLEFYTQITNRAKDQRLRVHFPLPFEVQKVHSAGHYEVLERDLRLPAADHTWVEDPRPEFPQREFVHVSGAGVGLLLANRGLPEVEVQQLADRGEIALTLLRGVGWLSRDDFSTRRGHAGPFLETPGAQMLGVWQFAYALIPTNGNWQAGLAEARAFNLPLRAAATDLQTGSLPGLGSFLQVKPETFVITAVKAPESGTQGAIVRGVNLSAEPQLIRLSPWRAFGRAEQINLAEEFQQKLVVAPDGSVEILARGFEIVSVQYLDEER